MSNANKTMREYRIERLLREGSALECIAEANYWLRYYMANENADLESVDTAQAFAERARALLLEEAQG